MARKNYPFKCKCGVMVYSKTWCCPSCQKVVPPSRFGYVIYGSEPVCWECDLKRSKKFDKVIGG